MALTSKTYRTHTFAKGRLEGLIRTCMWMPAAAEVSFNESYPKVLSSFLAEVFSTVFAASRSQLWRRCILWGQRLILTCRFLPVWGWGCPLDLAVLGLLVVWTNQRRLSPVDVGVLAVTWGIWRCGRHAGLAVKILERMLKESVTDGLLLVVVVVSLDCKSQRDVVGERHSRFIVYHLHSVSIPGSAEVSVPSSPIEP